MSGTRAITWLACVVSVAVVLSCSSGETGKKARAGGGVPSRIISLAPNITETLFALGLGERVVGVTDFCNYPPQARKLQRLGGYIDPNLEAMLRLRPDLVVLMEEHQRVKGFLAQNRIRSLTVDNHDVRSIMASIIKVAERCGVAKRGRTLAGSIAAEIDQEAGNRADTGMAIPRLLLCVEREAVGSGKVGKVWAAGRGTFYDDLIRSAGAENAIGSTAPAYPMLSSEGIIHLRPDVIVELCSGPSQLTRDQVLADWASLEMAPAVENGMVELIVGDYVSIPGPRLTLLLRDLRNVVRRCGRLAPTVEGAE